MGALTVREILKCRSEYILISRNAPYIRQDELGECNAECPVCSVDTFRVGRTDVRQFLDELLGGRYCLYYDGRCVEDAESQEESGWFEGEEQQEFAFADGQFIHAVNRDVCVNIIVSGKGIELCWQGRRCVVPEVDIADSDSFSVIGEI